MTMTKISPDDPRLTAFALGELEPDERAAVEAAVQSDPALQAVVEDIRTTASRLEFALASEAMEPAERSPAEAAIVAGHDPAKLDGGPATSREFTAKITRFPQFYYVIGGLAAACFAVYVALNPVTPRPQPMTTVTELKLAPASIGASMPSEATLEADAVKNEPARQLAAAADQAQFSPPPAALAPPRGLVVQKLQENEAKQKSLAKDERERRQWVIHQGKVGALMQSQAGGGKESTRKRSAGSRDLAVFGVTVSVPEAPQQSQPNSEAYAYRADNAFLGAAENPLSTFSIDVDTASYANVRRMLVAGRRPPVDAVRIEELLNYFPYRYTAPTGETPFAATMEVAEAPWAPEHRLVRIGLKGREVSDASRPAANLVFLLDVSGSMNLPNKLPLVKESMRLLVGRLRPADRVAIVVYAGASGLALPSTPVSRANEILSAIDELAASGSTNGAMGIQLAYDVAKANFVAGGVNRVILCTDGDFNVGVTSEGDLVRLIEEKAKSGVFLTALGFGMGNYKDATLQQLADKGNGNYGYVDTRREAEKLLVEQVNGTLVTVAKDVKLQVEFNPAQVARYRLIGYEKRLLAKEDFNNDAVDAGEIGAGHTVTALYEIVPVGAADATPAPGTAPAVDELKYRTPAAAPRSVVSDEILTLKVRYKEPAGEVSRKLEFPLVDRGLRMEDATADFKFAAAVAEFGLLLRDSPHKGVASFPQVLSLANAGREQDPGGYRSEFIDLVRKAEAVVR